MEKSMPVTAKLSQQFYERLGDDITNELVDWLNAVDATYRADLRELNDRNFARFEDKLDKRIAELQAQVAIQMAQMEAQLEVKLERGFKEQTRWLFVACASLLIPIMGLWIRRELS